MLSNKPKGVLGARMAGVKVAREATTAERAAPNKLLGVAEAKVLFVGYTDERGVSRTSLFFDVNGEYWSTRDSEQWCTNLVRMNDWLLQQVGERLQRQDAAGKPVDVPDSDAVDVLGTVG